VNLMSQRGLGWWGAVAVAMLTAGGPDPAGQGPESEFRLRPCQAGAEGGRGECGRLTVFENRAARRGRRIEVHFVVLRAERPGARQALLLFGGGPGQGSTALAPAADTWAKPVRASQDIVMVDQRGTGRSHPLNCAFDPEANPAGAFSHVFDPAAVARCRATLERDADLTQYTTDHAIDDVEEIRARLGYAKVSL
jgi:pimeloyl-ACP methyl ester carboxylesterase